MFPEQQVSRGNLRLKEPLDKGICICVRGKRAGLLESTFISIVCFAALNLCCPHRLLREISPRGPSVGVENTGDEPAHHKAQVYYT